MHSNNNNNNNNNNNTLSIDFCMYLCMHALLFLLFIYILPCMYILLIIFLFYLIVNMCI